MCRFLTNDKSLSDHAVVAVLFRVTVRCLRMHPLADRALLEYSWLIHPNATLTHVLHSIHMPRRWKLDCACLSEELRYEFVPR